MNQIAIIGAGALGRDIAMLIEQINQVTAKWDLLGFYDNSNELPETIYDYPMLGSIEALDAVTGLLAVIIAIGDTGLKRAIAHQLVNPSLYYPVLVHPSVIMAKPAYTHIGAGSVISAGSILTVNVNIGQHVLVNHNCVVGHDSDIGDYSSIMPGTVISGETNIGKAVYMGTRSTIINRCSIGDNTIIGAGAVVCNDIPSDCTAVGLPARPIKYHHPAHSFND